MAYKDLQDEIIGGAKTTTQTTTSAYEKLLNDIISGKYAAPSISAGAYTGQAQSLLGQMDTSGFDQLRSSMQSSYGTAQQGLEQSYQTMLENLAGQKETSQKQLANARGTIMEDSFSRNRDLYRNLAARGLGASGLQQLGEVQNRMETGRQVSGVTGQYYDTAEKLTEAEQQGTQQYQQSQQELANQIQQNLAGVQQQEVSYRNAYQQQLASLALQLQGQAQASASTNYASQMQAMMELAQLSDSRASEAGKNAIINQQIPFEDKVALWMDTYKVDNATARKEITSREQSYQAGLVSEILGGYDERIASVENFEQTSSILKDMKDNLYSTGQIDRNDIKAYILSNWDKFGNEESWRRAGLGGIATDFANLLMDIPGQAAGTGSVAQQFNLDAASKTRIQQALSTGKSQEEIADLILDFYKFY